MFMFKQFHGSGCSMVHFIDLRCECGYYFLLGSKSAEFLGLNGLKIDRLVQLKERHCTLRVIVFECSNLLATEYNQ